MLNMLPKEIKCGINNSTFGRLRSYTEFGATGRDYSHWAPCFFTCQLPKTHRTQISIQKYKYFADFFPPRERSLICKNLTTPWNVVRLAIRACLYGYRNSYNFITGCQPAQNTPDVGIFLHDTHLNVLHGLVLSNTSTWSSCNIPAALPSDTKSQLTQKPTPNMRPAFRKCSNLVISGTADETCVGSRKYSAILCFWRARQLRRTSKNW